MLKEVRQMCCTNRETKMLDDFSFSFLVGVENKKGEEVRLQSQKMMLNRMQAKNFY